VILPSLAQNTPNPSYGGFNTSKGWNGCNGGISTRRAVIVPSFAQSTPNPSYGGLIRARAVTEHMVALYEQDCNLPSFAQNTTYSSYGDFNTSKKKSSPIC